MGRPSILFLRRKPRAEVGLDLNAFILVLFKEQILAMSQNKSGWILRFFRWQWRLQKILTRITKKQETVYVWDRIPFYKQMWQDAAKELSLKFTELSRGIWEICYGERRTIIANHGVQIDDLVILDLSANKPFCYKLMEEKGIRVPKYVTFNLNELDKAEQFMNENKGLFVIKPAIGTSAGIGVTTHIQSYIGLVKATALASLYCDEIIIERLVVGECYRLLILNGKMIDAVRRRGVWLKGDGRSTILQLIEKENQRRFESRKNGSMKPLSQDHDFDVTLQAQGLSSGSIIKFGGSVLVKSIDTPDLKNVEVRTVYNENVTSLISQDIRNTAERAAMALNSKFAGVDIIASDPTVPLEKSGGVVNEINTNPGLHHHYNLINNDGPSPALNVLRYLLRINPE